MNKTPNMEWHYSQNKYFMPKHHKKFKIKFQTHFLKLLLGRTLSEVYKTKKMQTQTTYTVDRINNYKLNQRPYRMQVDGIPDIINTYVSRGVVVVVAVVGQGGAERQTN